MYARGTICGLTRGTNKKHIVRAALESIAYQTNDLISALGADSNIKIGSVRADGGAAANNFLMQFQADVSNTCVYRPESCEATALGAALLAGLAVGFWDRAEISAKAQNESVFSPQMEKCERERLLLGWQSAVNSCKTR
jgi:glycerol kinase